MTDPKKTFRKRERMAYRHAAMATHEIGTRYASALDNPNVVHIIKRHILTAIEESWERPRETGEGEHG